MEGISIKTVIFMFHVICIAVVREEVRDRVRVDSPGCQRVTSKVKIEWDPLLNSEEFRSTVIAI